MDKQKHNQRAARKFSRFGRTALRAVLAGFVLICQFVPYTYIGVKTVEAANEVPKILNYQARITNSSGVPVADGNLNIWISVYNAPTGGSCLYSMRGSCGTPSYKAVTVVNGVFSTTIGDTGTGDVEIPETLFDNNTLYLGITVASDTEMVPRKRVTAAPYAINADRLDDLDVTSSGSTTPYVVATTANGNLTITGDPQGTAVSNGSVYINPAAAASNETLFGIASNGASRFAIDKEGDIVQTGSLLATAASSTAQFIYRGASSQSNNIFEVQDSLVNRLFTVSSTSTLIGESLASYKIGLGNIAPANKLTVGSATSTFEVDAAGNLVKINNVAYSWPSSQGSASTVLQNNGSGTLSWTAASGLVNLNQAYLNATSTSALNAEISISPLIGAFTIADTLSGTGNIFEIQDRTTASGNYGVRYFTISSTSTLIGDGLASYKLGLGNIAPSNRLTVGSSTSTLEVDASGNLVKINNVAYSWPASQGGASTFLQNNGSGILSWAAASSSTNLNQAYLSATSTSALSAEISISPLIGAVTIADTLSGTGNIFEIQNRTTDAGDYSLKYLTVSSTSTQIKGASNVTSLVIGQTTDNGSSLTIKGDNAFVTSDSGKAFVFASPGAGALYFSVNGLNRFLINSAGDASFGHTSPNAHFSISERSSTRNLFEINDANSSGVYTTKYLTVSSTSTAIGDSIAAYNVGIGNIAPSNKLTVGSATSTFEVDTSGNLVKVNNVAYSWPSAQGAASTVLLNNGSGGLSWTLGSSLVNLNQAYLNATSTAGQSAEISISSAIGPLTIADAIGGTGNIFEIQDRTSAAGDTGSRYVAVSSTSTSIIGKAEDRTSGYVLNVTGLDGNRNVGSASSSDIVRITTLSPGSIVASNKSTMLKLDGLASSSTDSINAIQVNATSASIEKFHVTMAGSLYAASGATFGSDTSQGQVTIISNQQHNQTLGVYGDSISDGTTAYISANSLYTGVGLHVSSLASSIYTGSLIRTDSNANSTITTNGLISFNASGVYTSDSNIGLLNLSAPATKAGTIFSVSGNAITDGVVMSASSTSLNTGTLLKLSAGGSGSSANAIAVAQGAGNLFTVSATGTVTATLPTANNFAVCHAGSNGAVTNALLSDCAGTASADYMEMYPAATGLSMGDIVMPGNVTVSASGGSMVPQVVKTDGAYKTTMIGVISNPSEAGDFNSIGHEIHPEDNPLPVALKGRVRVKVNLDNGAIQVGDPVTSSSVQGVGMRSTKPGMIIGQALEAWNGPGQGTILVFMGNGFHSGLAVTTDGVKSLFADDFAFKPTGTASAETAARSSYALSFSGSAWDAVAGSAVTRNLTILNETTDPANYQLAFRNDAGNLLASLNQAGDLSIAGSLSVNGGFDYAEMFPAVPDIEPGDIVMVDPANANGYGIKKTAGPYENSAIGVVSTKPGFLTGDRKAEDSQPVALAGRVPVKVNVENGAINPGDPITASSVPGVGMKATEAGRVIGIALQGATESGVILAFVNPSWWNGPMPVGEAAVSGSLSITQDSLIDFKNSIVSNVAAIISTSGTWGITSDGYLVAQRVEAKEIVGERYTVKAASVAAESLVGTGKIQAGYDATLVINQAVRPESLIVVTFETNPGANWWIDEKMSGHFAIKLAQPSPIDQKFTYWIVPIDGTLDPGSGDTDSATGTATLPPTDPAPAPSQPVESVSSTPQTGGAIGSASGTDVTSS